MVDSLIGRLRRTPIAASSPGGGRSDSDFNRAAAKVRPWVRRSITACVGNGMRTKLVNNYLSIVSAR